MEEWTDRLDREISRYMMNGLMGQWTNVLMNGLLQKQVNDLWTNEWMDGWMDGVLHKQVYEWMNGLVDK